jgi:hypothetical protein
MPVFYITQALSMCILKSGVWKRERNKCRCTLFFKLSFLWNCHFRSKLWLTPFRMLHIFYYKHDKEAMTCNMDGG